MPTRARARRTAAAACAILAWCAACAGPELPDAPRPPRARTSPLPSEFPSPQPTPSGGGPAPGPTLPPAPYGGRLVRSGANFLEFLADDTGGSLVFFAFPYNARLEGIAASPADGSATLAIGGASSRMTASLHEGSLFFYTHPRVGPGSHQITVTARVKGVTYAGSFTYP